eukprot:c7030_g1_i2.p1 GENE.c7030_g1_i2~~c7030_g1_i2.p1  ORF type:complete len:253 (+),score=8.71 c7030_g1_i2:178-936(+)
MNVFRPRSRLCARSWGIACDCGDLCTCENCCDHPKVKPGGAFAKSDAADSESEQSQPQAPAIKSILKEDTLETNRPYCCCFVPEMAKQTRDEGTQTDESYLNFPPRVIVANAEALKTSEVEDLPQRRHVSRRLRLRPAVGRNRDSAATRIVTTEHGQSEWAGEHESSSDTDGSHNDETEDPAPKRRPHSGFHGPKKHSCPHNNCRAAFINSGDLTRHILTHSGARPFVCCYKGCSKRFSRKWSMHRHMKDAH